MSTAVSSPNSKFTPISLESLSLSLPDGYQNYFEVKRTGRWYGLHIACPVCGEEPPKILKYANRKWRWTAVHMLIHGDEEYDDQTQEVGRNGTEEA